MENLTIEQIIDFLKENNYEYYIRFKNKEDDNRLIMHTNLPNSIAASSSPSAKLHVEGTIKNINGSTGIGVKCPDHKLEMPPSSRNFGIGLPENMSGYTNTIIYCDGNIGIGT